MNSGPLHSYTGMCAQLQSCSKDAGPDPLRAHHRKKMEWLRAKLQDSEQIRGGGMRLGGPAGSVWTPSEADWLSAARIGRRRRAVAGDALAETTVRAFFGCSNHRRLDEPSVAPFGAPHNLDLPMLPLIGC